MCVGWEDVCWCERMCVGWEDVCWMVPMPCDAFLTILCVLLGFVMHVVYLSAILCVYSIDMVMQPNYRAQTRGLDCCTALVLHTIPTTPSPQHR